MYWCYRCEKEVQGETYYEYELHTELDDGERYERIQRLTCECCGGELDGEKPETCVVCGEAVEPSTYICKWCGDYLRQQIANMAEDMNVSVRSIEEGLNEVL